MPKTITLTDEEANLSIRALDLIEQSIVARMIKSKLSVSDQELRLIVLRGEYLPKNKVRYLEVDNITGEISGRECSGGSIIAYLDCLPTEGKSFAPPELAEELSQVIQGKWQYKKGDRVWSTHRKNPYPHYTFVYNGEMVDHDSRPEDLEFFASFPSEPQRATFIASIEKAKGETAEEFFVTHYDTVATLGFGNIQMARGLETVGTRKLNSLLTWARSQGYKG